MYVAALQSHAATENAGHPNRLSEPQDGAGLLRGSSRSDYCGGRQSVSGWARRWAFYGSQYALMAPLSGRYGIQLWLPEAGGPLHFGGEGHKGTMLAEGPFMSWTGASFAGWPGSCACAEPGYRVEHGWTALAWRG